MAFVTVSKPYLKQIANTGSVAAARILSLRKNPERTLSVLQIGITLVGAISAAVSGASAEEMMGGFFVRHLNIDLETAEFIAISIIVVPLTFVSVVIGELVPKSLALRFPLKFALLGGWILVLMEKIFSPFVFLLEISTKFITEIIFSRLKAEKSFDPSRELDLDPLSDSHKQYVFNLIDLNRRVIKDIMIPWEKVATIDFKDHYYHVLQKVRESRHTRMPVIRDGKIFGILHTKEFVSEHEVSKLDWTQLIRAVIFLNSNESILNALKKLQQNKAHLVVICKSDEPIGIVTLEDIFEEIVGDLYDEDEDPKKLLSVNARLRTMSLIKTPPESKSDY